MKIIEIDGKTVEEAIESALKNLKTTKDKVEIEILNEGNKGFLNIFGAKPARVRVKVKRDYIKEAIEFLRAILDSMDVKAEIKLTEENDVLNINLMGPQMGIIIGYRGETLDSLQYLVSLVVNKGQESSYKRVVLDTENYRAKREETLKRVAEKTAFRVKKFKKAIKLEPMNPYERRIIHATLQDDIAVHSYSEGTEPFRKIVVDIKK